MSTTKWLVGCMNVLTSETMSIVCIILAERRPNAVDRPGEFSDTVPYVTLARLDARPRLYNPHLPACLLTFIISAMASHTNAEQDTQLLSVGKQCSESSCLLVDFLPFKCQHCSKSFCGEHFLVAAHHCPQYDERKHDRIAPSCESLAQPSAHLLTYVPGPLCNTPVAIPPGEDPNIRMERHISTECNVMTGKSGRARSQPVCARGKCGKALYAPIPCNVRPAPLFIRVHPDAGRRTARNNIVLNIVSQRTTAARALRRPRPPLPSCPPRLLGQVPSSSRIFPLRKRRMYPVPSPVLCLHRPEIRPL